MIRVCVAGVTGWTGRAVADAVEAETDLDLVSGVSRSDPASFSSVAHALDEIATDVLVDYTHAAAVREHVLAAIERRVAVVVGSSGLSAADYEEIDAKARDGGVGVVAAGNFSLTAALLLRFAAEAARHLEAWEVIDYASAAKTDAPSGTARELAERLDTVRRPELRVPLDEVHGSRDARGATVSGTQVHSVRLPGFVVSTEIVFAADGERLSMRHDAGETPAPYVSGTLLAIRAVIDRVGLTRGLDRLLASQPPDGRPAGSIRRCNDEERATVLAIINAAAVAYRGVIPDDRWHEPYMAADELDREIDAGVTFWGYEAEGALIGVMGVQPVADVDLIRHAYVLPGNQRHGVGAALLGHLRRPSARRLLVGTWATAEWAVRFYRRNGFELVSPERKDVLLRTYWSIPERQIAASVVLADPPFDET